VISASFAPSDAMHERFLLIQYSVTSDQFVLRNGAIRDTCNLDGIGIDFRAARLDKQKMILVNTPDHADDSQRRSAC
jgi:hypothetical protein